MRTASWVIRNKTTKDPIAETWDMEIADAWKKNIKHFDRYEVVPILEHLVSLNLRSAK